MVAEQIGRGDMLGSRLPCSDIILLQLREDKFKFKGGRERIPPIQRHSSWKWAFLGGI